MIISELKSRKNTSHGTRYNPDPFYHTHTWKSIRAEKLRLNPYCECAECKGRKVPANTVDHIIPISLGGSSTHMSNLQSMTLSCHNKKSAKEKNEKYKKP